MDDDRSAIFLYTGSPHPVHKQWAESVGADTMQIPQGLDGFLDRETIKIRRYDTIIAEDSFGMRLAAFHKVLGGSFQLIRIIGDAGYYKIDTGGPALKGERWASSKVDGAVSVSNWIRGYAKKYMDCPIRTVYPFVSPERYSGLDPDTEKDERTVLFVGKHSPSNIKRKGVDRVIRAAELLQEFRFIVVGNEEEPLEAEHIEQKGFVDEEELIDLYNQADLFIQPSRRDSSPISVFESMLSGCIPIVSSTVGNKEVIEGLDQNIIYGQSVAELAQSIVAIDEYLENRKTAIRSSVRERAEPFTRERQIRLFKEAFEDVVRG